ncbi:MAG: nucleotidyl transferase AbiEii/AbiGii toxin family protein [Gammaproteobacteria bacterium]|nr:nucleotidyl transferase AbiEii/AbiGii toxin family protein [Gammaproteobacteria bacterium]
MKKNNEGLVVSVQARLLNHARKRSLDYNRVLERYALERFLYRLSCSPYRERFVLKGAMMMVVWLGEDIRPTRDADLLGFGELSSEALLDIFRTICKVPIDPDGMSFAPETLTIKDIREDDPYGGRRIALLSHLGNARLPIQVDIGIGDAVTPEPEWLDYPSLLDMPSARLRVYRPETSIAEKFHAMSILGMANSRMKDFFDIAMLAEREIFDGATLAAAIRTTFERRSTPLPTEIPVSLTNAFVTADKQRQWNAFIKRNNLKNSVTLESAVKIIHAMLWPVVTALIETRSFAGSWESGGPWLV